MIVGSLARRYARALLEIGIAQGNFEALGRELDDLAATYAGSRDLAEALTNPIFARAKRRAVLEAILAKSGVSIPVKNFALLLFEGERIPHLPAIARELRLMVDDKAGRVQAQITSATPLSLDQSQKIQAALERLSGKKLVIDQHEDPALLGGVVAKIGDVVVDGSLRTQLEQMRERFLQDQA